MFNGSTRYDHKDIACVQSVAIDTCLQRVGGVWNENVYTSMLPDSIKDNEKLNITHFEMVKMIIALKLWANQWKHQKVSIRTDNMAVVQICNNGYTRDMTLATYVRNLWLITAKYDIELVVTHIGGKDNIMADTLSS